VDLKRIGRPDAGSLGLLVLLLAAIVAAALVGPARQPHAGREASLWLAIESRAVDGDVELAAADRQRFRERFGEEAKDVLVDSRGGVRKLEAPPLWLGLLAGARRLLGWPGVHAAQALLVALAIWLGAATIRGRMGEAPTALLAAVAVLATAAFGALFRLEPRALEMAAMALAACAVWRRAHGPATPAADVYRGELSADPSWTRWLVAGGAFGLVALGAASYLVLALPLLAAAPESKSWRARGAFLVTAVAVFGAVALASGPPWAAAQPILQPRLLLWGTIGMLVGRGVGLLPYFLPATLLATSTGRDGGRRWVILSVLLAIVARLVLAPFDWAELSAGAGNAWFLVPLALLLAAASHDEGRAWVVTIALAGAPFLAAPVWLDSLGLAEPAAAASRMTSPLTSWLPEATPLRSVPGVAQLVRAGLVVRGLEPSISDSGDGRLRLSGRRGTLVVLADRALSSVRVELGSSAPVAIQVDGEKLGNTTIRPNGDLAVDLGLDAGAARRHPLWWSPQGGWIPVVEIRLPETPAAPIPLDVPFARSLIPLPGEGG